VVFSINVVLFSDKTATVLAKHIRSELLPARDEDDDDINSGSANVSASLPLPVIEAAIKSVLSRNNYGLDAPPSGGKLPAALCVWRWEVKEEHRGWLPKGAREKADGRLAERIQVGFFFSFKFSAVPKALTILLGKERLDNYV
jgi:chromatin assembly factor 1 subunit A